MRNNKRKIILFAVLFLGAFLLKAWSEESLPPLPKGPLLLTSVTRAQLLPNYWINRLPDPDLVLKTPDEIKKFNEDIHLALSNCVDVFKMKLKRPGKSVSKQIELEYNTVANRVLWATDDTRIPKKVFEEDIKPLVQWEKVPDKINIEWGAATRATSVRALPSDVKMLEKPRDIEFDQLQFTLIKLWTPVAIYHTSVDKKWYYIQAPYARGWVKAKDIALFKTRDQLKKYVKAENFLVVTGESIPIYSDSGLEALEQKISMGTVLPLIKTGNKTYTVSMPDRDVDGSFLPAKAYVNIKSDVSPGFPAFTQRNIIRQAFKLLGARYGWGGTYNGRDCSGFTHDVFLSLGIDMPRGSKEQAFVGTQINHYEPYKDEESKTEALHNAVPGITLLRMPHHQMLYLGEIEGKFYAIHSTWAERVSMDSDEKNRINQIVVSDLSLNGNSYLGSLFDRIISISEIN